MISKVKFLDKRSEEISGILKILSHPQRLLILCSLREEKAVSDLEAICGASQSAVSQFLKNMRLHRVITARREGKQIYYRLVDKRVQKIVDSLCRIFK